MKIIKPIPLEQDDPELGELLKGVIDTNKQYGARNRLIIVQNDKVYHKGSLVTIPMPNRNDPCICGSGKKYKKCCLNTL